MSLDVIAHSLIPPPHKRWSPTEGRAELLSPEGDILWRDSDWVPNALHDAGEQNVLSVWLKETAHLTKYLALLNDAGSDTETRGTMAAVTESKTPASGGYDRQQITAAQWTDDGLVGGDYRFSAVEKSFGPMSTAAATVTHAALTTTLTSTAGLLLLTLALSATTTVAVGQSLRYQLRSTAQ